jgi:phytoene dehydrogenase-like protein
LTRAGFSRRIIDAFWLPLFAGIQLDPNLDVSSRRFDLILRMLAVGDTGVPRHGIGAVPEQLAATLPADTVRFGARVLRVDATAVVLEDGERIGARAVVVATDGASAYRLLDGRISDPGSRAAACCWFAAAAAPLAGRALILDGDASGPAKNVAVMSEVSSSYAPPGRALLAAAVPGPDALEPDIALRVRDQLARWFGSTTREWDLLRTDVIAHGQPTQTPPFNARQRVALGGGIFVCGDHRDTASVQGALFSGERAAAAVLRYLFEGRGART